jgi:2-oxoglutarate dehydrogenase E1 component
MKCAPRSASNKVMTLTCTYDHRIIQGAESGLFLGKLQALLKGRWFLRGSLRASASALQSGALRPDRQASLPGSGGRSAAEVAKEAAVLQIDQCVPCARPLIAISIRWATFPVITPRLDPSPTA